MRSRAAVLLLPLVLAGCAGLLRSPQRPPLADVSLDVPVVAQSDPRQCGLAVATMVSRYHGRELSEQGRRTLVALTEKRGALSGADLLRAFRAEGFYVALFRGTLDETATGLLHHLERGRPLIVMLQRDAKGRSLQHYVVLTGYDAASGDWRVADPQWGPLSIDSEIFEESWARADHFTLLAVPRAGEATTEKEGNHHGPG